jgi:hypothetical protein
MVVAIALVQTTVKRKFILHYKKLPTSEFKNRRSAERPNPILALPGRRQEKDSISPRINPFPEDYNFEELTERLDMNSTARFLTNSIGL